MPRKRGYRRSGFYALKTTLRTLGSRVLDRRTSLGKQLAAWKADLIRDLGGDPSMTSATIARLLSHGTFMSEGVIPAHLLAI